MPLDPDFELPSSLQLNTGLDYRFDIPGIVDNLNLNFSYTYSKVQNALLWKDLRRNHTSIANNQPNATAPDGRAIYDTDVATEADTDFNTRRGCDMLLTNTDQGYSHNISLDLVRTLAIRFSINGSYAWQKVMDVNPGNSSLAPYPTMDR